MKQKLVAFFLVIVMVASTLTAIAATTATPVSAATATKTTLSVSKTNPVIGQSVTFTVTLKAGTTGLSKPVKIWHTTPDGKRWGDGTHPTVNGVYTFKQAFASKGQRIYHAEFAGDSSYARSSGTVTVTVLKDPTRTTLTVSKTNPIIGEQVTFTAKLTRSDTKAALQGKWVTIWHHALGLNSVDVVKKTDASGKITWQKSWTAARSLPYYASFGGDSQYVKSQAGPVTVTVQKIPTTTTITASNTNPTVYQPVTFTVTLKAGSTGLSKTVAHWQIRDGVREDLGPLNIVNGIYKFGTGFNTRGEYKYYAGFAGDSQYGASTGFVTINVQPIPTTLTFSHSDLACEGTPISTCNDRIIISGDLKAPDGTGMPGKVITFIDANGNLLVTSAGPVTATTDANGHYTTGTTCQNALAYCQIGWITPTKAHFAGDNQYAESWSVL